jgi:hypothetical protein
MTTWLEAVENIVINKIDVNYFTNKNIYKYEEYLKNKFPNNHTIQHKIRQVLQDLCKQEKILRLGRSSYSKIEELSLINKDISLWQDIKDLETNILEETTRQILVDARLGQGRFRKNLNNEFKESCIVTKAKLCLVASHIKPWRSSDNSERLNSKNGLLLSCHLDAFFDKGYITFDKKGLLIKSGNTSDIECERYGIKKFINEKIYDFCEIRQNYLEYHRDCVFQ